MILRFPALGACMLSLTLAACGGGSGDGGATPAASGSGSGGGTSASPTTAPPIAPTAPPPTTPSTSADGSWLSFSPAAPSITQYEGESVPVTVVAKSTRTFATPFNIGIIDANGVITTQVSVLTYSPTEYIATLRTAPGLSIGSHSTNLEVRLCEDSPLTCAKPLPGSPWQVPLTVLVKSKAEAAARLTLSVPSVSVATYPGEAATFSFEAQLNPELAAQSYFIGVVDPLNLTVPPATQLARPGDGHYKFNLTTATANNLPVGTYTSNLQLRMCLDDVRVCQQPAAGSPWILPLTLTVNAPTNLSPLSAIAGLNSWTTFQGNAAHTGFADASFDVAAFTRRWRMPNVVNAANPFASTAIEGGKVFFVRHGVANHWELVAVSEDSGEIAWKVDLGTSAQLNPPAVGNGRVYVTTTGSQNANLWVYDQASGAQLKKLPMLSQMTQYAAPTVFGTDVYTLNGYTGGISKYSEVTGTFAWNGTLTTQEGYSPATDGRFVYNYSTPDNILVTLNAADGSRAYTVGGPYLNSTVFRGVPVVLTDTQQAIVVAGKLSAFDLATHARVWSLDTSATGIAAYGNGTIYAFGPNGRALEARAPATGNLLWTSDELPGGPFTQVIVSRNLAFVSSTAATVAIDLATRKIVWTYPQGGNLAISPRGVLTILNDLGTLAAVNLR